MIIITKVMLLISNAENIVYLIISLNYSSLGYVSLFKKFTIYILFLNK